MMSLENREGKACEETEPEELPEKVNGSVLRVTGDCWRISASFCRSAGGRFFLPKYGTPLIKYAFNQSRTRNSDSSVAMVEK